MDNTNDTDALYKKHLDMIEHVLADNNTNEAGKRFVRGIRKFYDLQGYITDKQRSVLELIYSNSVEKIR